MTSMEIIINIIENHSTFQYIENEILLFKSYVPPNKELTKINKAKTGIDEHILKHFYCESSSKHLSNIVSKIFNILKNDDKIKIHDNGINIFMFKAGIYHYTNHPVNDKAYKLTKKFYQTSEMPFEYNLLILDMICFYLNQIHQINILFSNGSIKQ